MLYLYLEEETNTRNRKYMIYDVEINNKISNNTYTI